MRSRWRLWLALAGAIAITSCGQSAETTSQDVATAAATGQVAADECWTPDQRATAEAEEGEPEMAGQRQYRSMPAMTIDPSKRYTATLQTSKGSFDVEFFPEDAPITVNNFVCLARDGYYDNTPFHRIIAGFMFQGGDPTGTGRGGPGYQFQDEPIKRDYTAGTLAMANAGPNTNGSQFFVVLADQSGTLPKNYTIFGRVTGGQEVVEAIGATPVRAGATGERSVPTEPVTLEKVTIREG